MARPNIILICADQHRWDCAGCAGNADIRTPNLDILAAHGVRFPQAICQFPSGAPSRATILTGQHPSTHGVGAGRKDLPNAAVTFPQLLANAGYWCGCVGKMDSILSRSHTGFDVMKPAEQQRDGQRQDDYHAWLEGRGLADQMTTGDHRDREMAPTARSERFGARASNLPEDAYSTTWIGDRAVQFLRAAREPFFLYTGFTKPRHPFDPPPPWHKMYPQRALTLPEGWRLPISEQDLRQNNSFDFRAMTESRFRRVLSHYYANISLVDKQVGRILATLSSRSLTNNLIVYTADHGDYMGQHGLILKGGQLYDSVLRVPLVIAGLARQGRGQVDPTPVELADLMPTFLEAATIRIPKRVEGKSLVGLLCHRGSGRRAAFAEGPHGAVVVRTAGNKLVESPDQEFRALYDLNKDPHEFRNLYGTRRAERVQAQLTELLQKRYKRGGKQ
ncbi:MAG TPA: sulfatase-like hydrolase/transferase [Candidatus Hydrogenedentes bacterium]|nr:sulfatase-like hydrolase/transferase [Candidatus Hydrogenedentota bacterium]